MAIINVNPNNITISPKSTKIGGEKNDKHKDKQEKPVRKSKQDSLNVETQKSA